ncbi:MAG TPA: sulfotransferase [Nitrosomonas sp.]|nr:sulfotransferase [Nitrosomonas sp.]HMY43610.1 sulfotransferase [Chitinophagales bacterium]HMW20484.1 sulfotransferase [Nitrosomonas sp.]HMW67809.1 sulfotransferase [Nitrosomonas sp.]HMY89134.1 sulfotransferase [Nitrosomonas sp.]
MIAQVDSTYIRIRPWKLWSRLVSYVLFEGRPITTRGQWINPLLFAHFAIEKKLPLIAKKVEKPVFILGTGRSGTTILGVILSMHRHVGFLNEPKAIWHSIYPNEDLIGNYSLNSARYRLEAKDASSEVIQSAHRIFGTYLATTFSERLVDKYPELIFRIPFIRTIFPNAKFLFITRNGWDTCSSISNWSNRLGLQAKSEIHDWWGRNRRKWNLLINEIVLEHNDLASLAPQIYDWSNQSDMAAVEWIVTMREGLKLQEQFPNDILQVRYETLCLEPTKILSEILKFTELSVDDAKFFSYAQFTLQPSSPKNPFELNKLIEEPFYEVMHKLGYKSE